MNSGRLDTRKIRGGAGQCRATQLGGDGVGVWRRTGNRRRLGVGDSAENRRRFGDGGVGEAWGRRRASGRRRQRWAGESRRRARRRWRRLGKQDTGWGNRMPAWATEAMLTGSVGGGDDDRSTGG
ncbi:hypothetical protein E2562_026926 [Oryza meyeriana var. granulata]|uniref:Uncharacterized protein n=1 Tax=Oryza meyeriana var. granulata TaxID=110450 RepID=A0A6G1CTF1_9ORYZ|nr:hypothetical protein E2562_026926 [Oryza meyeriana var. granulata]